LALHHLAGSIFRSGFFLARVSRFHPDMNARRFAMLADAPILLPKRPRNGHM
jgi:hypothetical protein